MDPMHGLKERTSDRLATAQLVTAAVTGLAGAFLAAVAWSDLAVSDSVPNLVSAVAGVTYASLGALIVRRVRNTVGWILEGVGVGMTLLSLTSAYAVVGSSRNQGPFRALGRWVRSQIRSSPP